MEQSGMGIEMKNKDWDSEINTNTANTEKNIWSLKGSFFKGIMIGNDLPDSTASQSRRWQSS